MIEKDKFLEIMKFPREWDALGIFPDKLSDVLCAQYEVGHEAGSEHDRNGAFHWWNRQNPSREVLLNLIELSRLDPDPLMAADARRYIARSANADEEIRQMVSSLNSQVGRDD